MVCVRKGGGRKHVSLWKRDRIEARRRNDWTLLSPLPSVVDISFTVSNLHIVARIQEKITPFLRACIMISKYFDVVNEKIDKSKITGHGKEKKKWEHLEQRASDFFVFKC